MKIKKFIILILVITAISFCTAEDNVLQDNYKAFTIDKTASAQKIIENELFGVNDVNSTMVISSSNAGNYSDYYFYMLDDENICLGIKSYNQLQNDAVIYINTQKECGTVCKVYLDEAQEKQIFYVW